MHTEILTQECNMDDHDILNLLIMEKVCEFLVLGRRNNAGRKIFSAL
jgi:hypothetical protein